MKNLHLATCLSCLLSMSCYAGVSTTITGTSDYIYDGISQTDGDPTLQASLDYSHNQFYAGVWTSRVDFDDDQAEREIDYYLGWTDSINDDFSYDLSALYYQYPTVDTDLEYNYSEFATKLNWQKQAWIKVGYEPNYSGNTGKAWFTKLGADRPLNDIYTAHAEYGRHQSIDSDTIFFGDDHYNYWKVGVSRGFFGVDINVSYSDTDVSNNDWADDTVLLTAVKTFTLIE